MNRIALIFFIVLINATPAFSQWMSVEDGSSGSIRLVRFKNPTTGWYIADFNLLYKTTNGGQSWKGIDIPNIIGVGGMSSMENSEDTLWVPIGRGESLTSRIMKSTNGGDNWTAISTGFGTSLANIQRLESGMLYAAAKISSSKYSLVKSTNGGLNWLEIYVPPGFDELRHGRYSFGNDTVGYTVGVNGNISRTTDGGNSWNLIYTNSFIGQIDYIKFINGDLGFITANLTYLYKTSNGGASWDSLGPYSAPYRENKIVFTNTSTGYMLSRKDSNYLLKSTDAGSTWQKIYSYPFDINSRQFEDMDIAGSTFYIAAQSGGGMFKSTDNGQNWSDISKYSTQFTFQAIDFINSQTGFIGGIHGGLFNTTNGGINWSSNSGFNSITDTNNRTITDIQFVNQSTGWIATDTGLFNTTNGGLNWMLRPDFDFSIRHIHFINAATGWVLGYEIISTGQSKLFKTTNGGANFELQYTINDGFTDMEFYDSEYGYMTSDNLLSAQNLFRTTDGGDTWQRYNFGLLQSVDIINRDTAYLGGGGFGNGIYKTTNGGDNWTEILDNGRSPLDIEFINSNTGFASYYLDSTLLYTLDGGENWEYYNIGSIANLITLYFNDSGLGIIGGGSGKIYRTDNYGGIVSIEPINEITPATYQLYQNYPNPFNPETKIKYDIKNRSIVQVEVYDMLGKKVSTLINENLSAGSYEISFNGSGLPSGVYFYTLSIDGKPVNTKRMVLLK